MAGHRYASPSPQPPRHQGLCAIERWRIHDSEFAFKSFATVPLSFHGCRPTKSKFDVCVCVCRGLRVVCFEDKRGGKGGDRERERGEERGGSIGRERREEETEGRKRGALKLGRIGDGRR